MVVVVEALLLLLQEQLEAAGLGGRRLLSALILQEHVEERHLVMMVRVHVGPVVAVICHAFLFQVPQAPLLPAGLSSTREQWQRPMKETQRNISNAWFLLDPGTSSEGDRYSSRQNQMGYIVGRQ